MLKRSIIMALTWFTLAAQAQLIPGGQTGSGKPNNDPGRPGQYDPCLRGGAYCHPGSPGRPQPPPGYYPPPHRPNPPPHHPPHNPPYYPPPHRPTPPPYYPPHNPPYYPPQNPPYYPPPSYPTPPPPSYSDRIVVPVYVGRSVNNEMISLNYLHDLNSRYYGWAITAVRAQTRPNSPYRTVARLMTADRVVYATEVNPGYNIDLFPDRTLIAGYQETYLWIEGSTFIESIEVELYRR